MLRVHFTAATLLVAASAGACAQGAGLTRAEVQQEFQSSREQSKALTGEDSGSEYLKTQRAASAKAVTNEHGKRQAVTNEFLANRETAKAMTSEDSGSVLLSATAKRSTRTRQEVVEEFQRSREEVRAMTGEDSGSVYLARAPKTGPVLLAVPGGSNSAVVKAK